MQDPNEDTEWNDILRAKGILGPKPKEAEITEEQIQSMIDEAIQKRTDLKQSEDEKSKKIEDRTLDELDELEDSEDEEIIERYRQMRLAEIKALAEKPRFGYVKEIPGQDYVSEVTKAGEDIWVVLHLYATGIPHCALIHRHMEQLAVKFPQTKFVRSIAQTCIPNFPDKNLPTIFIYYEGDLKNQFIGTLELRGEKLTCDELEYLIGKTGAIQTEIKEDPRPRIKDKMLADLEDRSDGYF